ncbi:hypothetical protein BK011_04560 [Tenericutes bacterium MZ-XQ]|nr:hypothetical protein BK011_04560 [Tenericutes bacterium MZ-XQ]
MRHLTFDNEEVIMEFFRDPTNKVLAFPQGDELLKTFNSINNEDEWSSWVNASKTNTPPDFYNEELKLMMDVMRFDDQQTVDGKKHATKSKETELLKELKESGILDIAPNATNVFINAVTDLPQNEDHNFKRYRGNFKRVIEKHAKRVQAYRENHPRFKLIFFVFDESRSMYAEKVNYPVNSPLIQGMPYWFFIDEYMVDIIKKCGADFLVWFKPYYDPSVLLGLEQPLPTVIMYDLNNLMIDTKKYNENNIISLEE